MSNVNEQKTLATATGPAPVTPPQDEEPEFQGTPCGWGWWQQKPEKRAEIGVGTLIKKHFVTPNIFNGLPVPYDGVVQSTWTGPSSNGKSQEMFYRVLFNDGDEEDLSHKELLPCANLFMGLSSSNLRKAILPFNDTIAYYFTSSESVKIVAKKLGCQVSDIVPFNEEWHEIQLGANTKLKVGTILRIDPTQCDSAKIQPLLSKPGDWLNQEGESYMWRSFDSKIEPSRNESKDVKLPSRLAIERPKLDTNTSSKKRMLAGDEFARFSPEGKKLNLVERIVLLENRFELQANASLLPKDRVLQLRLVTGTRRRGRSYIEYLYKLEDEWM